MSFLKGLRSALAGESRSPGIAVERDDAPAEADRAGVCLCVIFNHPFPGNLPLLRRIYQGRFSHVRFLMPLMRREADVLYEVSSDSLDCGRRGSTRPTSWRCWASGTRPKASSAT